MRHLSRTIAALLLLLPLFAAGQGCSDIDELNDCSQVCESYQDCKDADFDVSDCIDRCEDRADDDSDFSSTLNVCEACLDDRSCDEGWSECSEGCLSVIQSP